MGQMQNLKKIAKKVGGPWFNQILFGLFADLIYSLDELMSWPPSVYWSFLPSKGSPTQKWPPIKAFDPLCIIKSVSTINNRNVCKKLTELWSFQIR